MVYDFNSLTKQADEANNRDKFYTDFEDVDQNKLHQISELTDWMRTKAKGSDVREIIAQLFERTWLENIKEGNANREVSQARGSYPNLKSRLDEVDNKQNKTTAQLAEKANKDEVTNVMTPKGTLAYASLPKTGNSVGWYYYCPDGDGTHGAGNYVWNGTSWFFGGTGDEGYNLLKKDIVDLDELFNWSADKTNILNGVTPVIGEYVDYANGGNTRVASYEWYEISVTEGQTFKYNGNNAHVAFFSEKYTGLTNEYYLSGLLTQENVVFTVPKNAVSMTLSVPIDYPNWLGKGDDEYAQNTTIKKECLPKVKQTIVVEPNGTYANIVKAVKECEENATIIVRSGTYDLEAQFKEVYGNDFFVNYKGYIADSNFELSGLYLKRGVKLIADSGTVLSFMYSGNNPKVSEEFSPINMTVDNIVDGFIIEVNSNVRYHVHDDFAFMAFMNINNYGQNEIKNCVFKGNSTAGSVIGGGMGTYCKYIVHDNCFENTIGNAVSYHNASFSNAQNFIDIFNNYAKTPIKLWWYGDSTKITTALVHNNTASLIECAKIPNYDAPNENIKMKAWNNSIV